MRRWLADLKSSQANWPTPLEAVRQAFPFDIRPEHQADILHYAVREHGDFVATGGRDWPQDRRHNIRALYAMLRQDNSVITYSDAQGWAGEPRRRDDGDLIIRIENPTEEQSMIWRFLPDELAP